MCVYVYVYIIFIYNLLSSIRVKEASITNNLVLYLLKIVKVIIYNTYVIMQLYLLDLFL